MRNTTVLAMMLTSAVAASSASAQDRTRACLDAANVLVAGSQSRVTSEMRSGGRDLSWESASGHQGVCRYDGSGRLYLVQVTRFPADDGSGNGQSYHLTCESNDYRRGECQLRYNNPRVRVERQLSTGAGQCISGRTFGVDGEVLWVDGGCRAVFEIIPRGRSGRSDDEAAMDLCVRTLERHGLQVVRHTGTRGYQRYLDLTFTVRRGWTPANATCRYDRRFGTASLMSR